MAINVSSSELRNRPEYSLRIGLVVDSPELLSEISRAIAEAGATQIFQFPGAAAPFEIANAVQREKPDVLFAELARTSKPAAEWMMDVRRGEETPYVVAIHAVADPAEMISALRAGASEFLSLPVRPAIFEALDKIGARLESRRSATVERGRIAGVLSPKGGCGATSVACYLSAALQLAAPSERILVADLDYQSPGTHNVFRVSGTAGSSRKSNAGDALDAVRGLSSSSWREFVTMIAPGVDLLMSPGDGMSSFTAIGLPEQWRLESLFRFMSRQYSWVLVDLGRHLNPVNWTVMQNVNDLYMVTAPDVLALYQTRSVLQTLSNRGFDKSRVKIILNRNMSSPQDFWVESIQQMFEMSVFGVIPNDESALGKLSRDKFEFPAETPFGHALAKIAGRILRPGSPSQGSGKRAA